MIERDKYLAQVFGDEAQTIGLEQFGGVLVGRMSWWNRLAPLSDVENDGLWKKLQVTEKHCAGHFIGPKTFPAYRMLELLALLGGGKSINKISNASFQRIVKPGDTLIAKRHKDVWEIVRNIGVNNQSVSKAKVELCDAGVIPWDIGILLEISAQTIVGNMLRQKPDELLYPLILGFDELKTTSTNQIGQELMIIPDLPETINPKGDFIANASIVNEEEQSVADLKGIKFQLASERAVEMYDWFGRGWQEF